MPLSLDFPRDGEVLEPSGIQARPELDLLIRGDAFEINSHRYVLIPRHLLRGSRFYLNIRTFDGSKKRTLPDAFLRRLRCL
jgi:hypothetical protein